MSSLSRKKFGEGYLFTFLVCIVTAAVLYTPFLIIDKGLFQYCGDFNSQQIPFYTYMNGFVKTAGGQWSWNTDLGTSAINGYSFYLLGSPFFWLSTLLPQSAVPYAMVPLLVLKFGVCGLAAYTYLYRYAKTRQAAVIASVLYAFSGFTVYNTFFNHFLDCIALFPLLLWALDEAVLENRKALLPVLLAVNLVNNYFFFAGQAVFLIIYFVWKAVRGEYRLRTGLFFRLAFETVLGCAMGCVLLVPAVSFLLGNPRTVDPASGFGFLIYSKPQQYFAILTSLFLPPDPTYLPNIFTDCIIKHTSMTAYLPVVGAAGVFAYMGARKRSANTAILWTCLVMALVPVLNSSFYALNSSYYARWYYMPILIMCAATMHALEDADIDLMRGIRPVAVITACGALAWCSSPRSSGLSGLRRCLACCCFSALSNISVSPQNSMPRCWPPFCRSACFIPCAISAWASSPSGRTTPITAGRCSRLRPALHGRRTISTGWIPTSARTTSA